MVFFCCNCLEQDIIEYEEENHINNQEPLLNQQQQQQEKEDFFSISPSWVSGINVTSQCITDEHLDAIKKNLPSRLQSGIVFQKIYSFEDNGIALNNLKESLMFDQDIILIIKTTNNKVFGSYLNFEPPKFHLNNSSSVNLKLKAVKNLNSQSSLSSMLSDDSDGLNNTNNIRKISSSGVISQMMMPIPTGECFLFSFAPDLIPAYDNIKIYNWKGENIANNFLVTNEDCIALGLYGKFALYINEDMKRGSSSKCKTFNNENLAGKQADEFFEILAIEVFCMHVEKSFTKNKSHLRLSHITEAAENNSEIDDENTNTVEEEQPLSF